ncbi:MAG: hypothetical protein E7466_06195 [Ruminococcaceae bacterium]|nr:hypothetical protein [Oscillospiraceae bacterium]
MKKKSIFVLLLAVCLLLTGCQGVNPVVDSCINLLAPAEHCDVTVTPSLYWKEGRLCMDLAWSNHSVHTILYGHHFSLRRLEGEEWVRIEYEPNKIVTPDIALILHPGQSKTETYYVGSCYYFGQPGQYRLTTSYDVEDENGYIPQKIIAEFTVNQALLNRGRNTFDVAFSSASFSTPVIGAYMPEPVSTAVYTPKQLDSYIAANEEFYDFATFEPLRAKCDNTYFDNHYVIIVPVVGAQDAVDNEVVQLQGDYLGNHQVTVSRQYRSIGTGAWHIVLEVEKEEFSTISHGPYVETIRTSVWS